MNQPFLGIGLDPVAPLDARRLGRAEVDRRGAVGARLGGGRRIALAARARIALRRVEHRARLVVVERERPEVRLRNVLRQRHLVGLGAVEGFLSASTIVKRYCEPMPGRRMAIAGVMPVTP